MWRTVLAGMAALLVVLAPGGARSGAAQGIDPAALLLDETDLPRGFARQDATPAALALGVESVQAGASFRREGAGGAITVHSRAVVLAEVDPARTAFGQVVALLVKQGSLRALESWFGDEAAGYRAISLVEGTFGAEWTFVERTERLVSVTTVIGSFEQVDADTVERLAGGADRRAAAAVGRDSTRDRGARRLLAGAAETDSRPTAARRLREYDLLDPPSVGGDVPLGGLSGLDAVGTYGAEFVAVTDRGPNRPDRGGPKGTIFSLPGFSPSIVRLRPTFGRLEVVQRIPLRLASGVDRVTGSPGVSGLPNGGRDEPAFDELHRPLGEDPNGVDPEGLALDPRDGSFWVCEEYGPSVLHVAPDGTILTRLVPDGLGLSGTGYPVSPILPRSLLERKPNRGFEGIAISPDGQTVFAIMQSALWLPDRATGESSRNIRLLALDVSGDPRLAGIYVYRAEPFGAVGGLAQDGIKVGDLAAVSATHLLAIERDTGFGGSHRKIYQLELEAATNLLGRDGMPLEALSDDDLARAGIQPVGKRLVVDLYDLGFAHVLVEGLAIVDDTTIAVSNDNNYSPYEPSGVLLIRLGVPLR